MQYPATGGPARFACEFCGQHVLVSMDDTVCSQCDATLEADQRKEQEARDEKWGAAHKCTSCSCALPEARYAICFVCAPADSRSLADPTWDVAPDHDGFEDEEVQMTRICRRLLAAEMKRPTDAFHCNSCSRDLPMAECSPKYKGHGKVVYTRCKQCHAAKEASRYAKRAAALSKRKAERGVA